VGVRKALGSARIQLRTQFLFESVLLSLFATVVALVLVQLAVPFFNELMGKALALNFRGVLLPLLAGIALGAGFLAGSYPAFVLSSFNPVLVMKGNFSGSGRGSWLRNGLVVFQFSVSIALIAGTLIVQDQMRFLRNKQLGFDKDQMLVVERVNAMDPPVRETFVQELRRLDGVESVGSTFSVLGREGDFFGSQYQVKGSSEILTTKNMAMDDYLAETVQLELAAGRWFSTDTNDSLNIILNETAVKTLGLTDPVGMKIDNFNRTPEGRVIVEQTIIGVVRDFNFQTLRDPVTPLVIQSNEAFGGGVGLAYVRLQAGQIQETVNRVEAKWKELAPALPFKFLFLDEEINAQYRSEQKNGKVLAVFSALAILIACVGLFGLAAYTASLRTKEIGIRKVLGSSVRQVVFLLSKDLTGLVLVSFVLAAPASWYVMNRYFLDSFTYRINPGGGTFLLAGGLAMLIALITVSYQSIRAALANPVNSLRSE
jgi:putative ABC transport system permease protein